MGIIRDSFVMFTNWVEAIEALPEEFQLECFKAVSKYGLTGEIPEGISPITKALLISFSKGMENNIARYHASVENGKKGGRPRKEPSTEIKNLEKPSKTQENLEEPTRNLNVNVNVNDCVNENVCLEENTLTSVKEDETSSPSKRPQKHKYGIYKNVLLTKEEFDRLMAEPDGEAAIDYFSTYREMKGYKCKNDNLAIRKWAFNGIKEERQREARLNKQPPASPRKESPMEQLNRVLGG